MTQEPQTHTSELAAYNLLTYGDYQFAVWYTLAGELRIGRIQRGAQRWGVDHDEYEFAGAPRATLALPVADDVHNYPTVAVDKRGFVHVWANMHDSTMRAVRTTTAHTTGDWLASAGWTSAAGEFPGILARCTYPIPVRFDDGGLLFFIRDLENLGGPGGSGKSDSVFYTRSSDGTAWEGRTKIFQGLAVPGAATGGGTGSGSTVDDRTNWSAYPTVPVVESARGPHPGRLHMSWVWRTWQDSIGADNICPSYGYSDDRGATWYAIDGTALTLPITPLNNVRCRLAPATGSAIVTEINRTGNIVVALLDVPAPDHGISLSETVTVDVDDTGYNGSFVVALVGQAPLTANGIAWGQVAADDPAGGRGAITNDKLTNYGSLTVDDDGLPHILCSTAPTYYYHRNAGNTAWEREALASVIHGVGHQVRSQAFWRDGHLWMLATGGVSSLRQWHPQVWQLTGPDPVTFRLGGPVDSFGQWEPAYDPEAYRRFGTIEVLTPGGNTPRVATFGRRTRVRPRAIAAA